MDEHMIENKIESERRRLKIKFNPLIDELK
jgi:hypothetical protein